MNGDFIFLSKFLNLRYSSFLGISISIAQLPIEIIDKKIIGQYLFLRNNFFFDTWIGFFLLIFVTKNANADGIIIFDFMNVSNFDWKFYFFKIKFFSKIFVRFYVILADRWFAGLKYLTKHHLKHSLWSIFLILINPFLGKFNSCGNFIQLFPAKGLYFEIIIEWSMTESIIHPEPFPEDYCMFDITVV